jgi:hypothetical protein
MSGIEMLRAEFKRRELSYADLADKLAAIGIKENEQSNKIGSGTFTADFLVRYMDAGFTWTNDDVLLVANDSPHLAVGRSYVTRWQNGYASGLAILKTLVQFQPWSWGRHRC